MELWLSEGVEYTDTLDFGGGLSITQSIGVASQVSIQFSHVLFHIY